MDNNSSNQYSFRESLQRLFYRTMQVFRFSYSSPRQSLDSSSVPNPGRKEKKGMFHTELQSFNESVSNPSGEKKETLEGLECKTASKRSSVCCENDESVIFDIIYPLDSRTTTPPKQPAVYYKLTQEKDLTHEKSTKKSGESTKKSQMIASDQPQQKVTYVKTTAEEDLKRLAILKKRFMEIIKMRPNDWLKSGLVEYINDFPIQEFEYVLVLADIAGMETFQFLELILDLKQNGFQVRVDYNKNDPGDLVYIKIHNPGRKIAKEAKGMALTYMRPNPKEKCFWLWFCFGQFSEKQNLEVLNVTSAQRIIFLRRKIKNIIFDNETSFQNEIIISAYPLHDGKPYKQLKHYSDRNILSRSWGRMISIFRPQPLQLINKYFGSEVTLCFAWIGFLNILTLPVIILGIVTFSISMYSVGEPTDTRIVEICTSQQVLCPTCKNFSTCDFAYVNDSCNYSTLNYIVDNKTTAVSSFVFIAWIALLIPFWTMVRNCIKLELNLCYKDVDETLSPETAETEAQKAPVSQFFFKLLSIAAVIVLIAVLFAFIFGIIKLRIELVWLLSKHKIEPVFVARVWRFWILPYRTIAKPIWFVFKMCLMASKFTSAIFVSTIITSILSGIGIISFSKLLPIITTVLTNFEDVETHEEYNHSYIYKLFILEFVNHYGLALYLAVIRGSFETHPMDVWYWESHFGIHKDLCDPSGCIFDIAVYVIIVFMLKALCSAISMTCFIMFNLRRNLSRIDDPQWKSDFCLADINYNRYMADLYMQAVINYGFMIFFTPIFYLLPLLVFIVNFLQMRINAKLFCQIYKRPVPRMVTDLEIWDSIFIFMAIIGLIINVLIINFTSDAVKRSIFSLDYPDGLRYNRSTFSRFRVRDHPSIHRAQLPLENQTFPNAYCYHRGLYMKTTKTKPPRKPNITVLGDLSLKGFQLIGSKIDYSRATLGYAFAGLFLLYILVCQWVEETPADYLEYVPTGGEIVRKKPKKRYLFKK